MFEDAKENHDKVAMRFCRGLCKAVRFDYEAVDKVGVSNFGTTRKTRMFETSLLILRMTTPTGSLIIQSDSLRSSSCLKYECY